MKVEIEYTELLDIVNALLARAAHFERLPAESAGLEPDHWQREATKHRAITDKLLAQADDADDEDDEGALKKAKERGERAFIHPPLKAWGGKY